MEWPKRYKLKGSVLLLAIIAVIFGIWLQRRDHQNLTDKIIISELSFNDWGSQYIELGYVVENTSDEEVELHLLAKIWDEQDIEIASSLFSITVPPHIRQSRSKLFDRLNRSLKEGERPYRANIVIYPKRTM
nr:hypothetical protein [Candidatus Cloacimonadota bacterium]